MWPRKMSEFTQGRIVNIQLDSKSAMPMPVWVNSRVIQHCTDVSPKLAIEAPRLGIIWRIPSTHTIAVRVMEVFKLPCHIRASQMFHACSWGLYSNHHCYTFAITNLIKVIINGHKMLKRVHLQILHFDHVIRITINPSLSLIVHLHIFLHKQPINILIKADLTSPKNKNGA